MRSTGHMRRLAACAVAAGCALPVPAAGVQGARYILSAEFTGTQTEDVRGPDGQIRMIRLRTTWSGTSVPFRLINTGTAARPRLVSPLIEADGLIQHSGTGTEDRGDWHDVTGGPKVRDCITNVRQFLAGPAVGTATVRILGPGPGGLIPQTALFRLAAHEAAVRTNYSGYSCTLDTAPGEPTDVVSIGDLVTDCPGCLALPITTLLKPRWPLVPPAGVRRIVFRRPITLMSSQSSLDLPVLRQSLPFGGSLELAFSLRLTLTPVR